MRRLLPLILLAMVPGLAGAEADPPAAKVDRSDPVAVAEAYLAAAAAKDVDAALALAREDAVVGRMVRMMTSQAELKNGLLGIFTEYSVLPAGLASEAELGDVATAEGALRVNFQHTVRFQHTLVLIQDENGAYAVDLRASIKATAGEGGSLLMQQIEAMERMERQGQRMPSPDGNPWQCQNKLRELGQALSDYADEHDGKYPLAAVWMDELEPYLDGDKLFTCPVHPKEEYSYAFNEAMDGATKAKDWRERQKQVLLACVGYDMPNATFHPDDLKDLTERHGQVNTYAAADLNARSVPVGMTPGELQQANDQNDACQRRLRNLVTAAKKYAAEHDGRLPEAATWTDDLQPYLDAMQLPDGGAPLVCPDLPDARCTYAINAELAGKELAKLVNYRKLLLFIETDDIEPNSAVTADYECEGRHRTMWNAGAQKHVNRAYLNGTVRQAP